MRILHLIPSLGGGGSERQLVLLAQEQVRHGHVVHVGVGSGGVWREALQRTGADVHMIPNRGNHDPMIPARIAELIRSTDPAVVQTWLRQMDICGGAAALALRRTWVLGERSSELAYRGSWKHWARKTLAHRAAAIVSNSQLGDRYWGRHVGAAVRRFVIPNAIDLDEIDRIRPGLPRDIPRGAPIVLFAARLNADKNLAILLPALERVVCGATPNAVALLCGEGPASAFVRAWLSARGLLDRVRLLGFRHDVWSIMKAANVLVSISRFEGHPNSVIEAMACGCPIVVSDIPAHRDLLDDCCAAFVPADDVEKIADAITSVLAAPEEAKRRAAQARLRVAGYSIARVASAFDEVYETVLRRNGRAA